MKKRIVFLCALTLCIIAGVLLWTVSQSGGDISQVEIDYGHSQFFTEREMEQAAKALMDDFKKEFPYHCLTKIWYVTDLQQLENDRDVQYDGRNIIFYSDIYRKTNAEADVQPKALRCYRWCVAVNDAGRWYVAEHGF